MSLSPEIVTVLAIFQSAFTTRTWEKAQVLIIGTLLARGRRTVAAALRQMGRGDEADFSLYHQVLNRGAWSARELSRLLLLALIKAFVAVGGSLTFVIDETLERRWGPMIRKRGHYRDSLLSSRKKSVSNSGLRWIVLTLVVNVAWTRSCLALPVMSVLAPTPKVSRQLKGRHKTVAHWARQIITQVRRWLPGVPITLLGDGAYSVVELGVRCQKLGVTLSAPLLLNAQLYGPPPPALPGQKKRVGRPAEKGARLPKLSAVLVNPQTVWEQVSIAWYDGQRRVLELASGTALWKRAGSKPLPIRWVLVRDPSGELEPRAYFTTDPTQAAVAVIEGFVLRWTIEVMFEESRAHLGIETQRQWSDLAIERSTPCLFGLYSLVALLTYALHPDGNVPIRQTAWYQKQEATFADALATVRRHLWGNFNYLTSPHDPDVRLIPQEDLIRLAQAVCYSH
ncbi:MAG: transposase [Blastocatellales bacterium]|nr:transposase [Blastocatellales bacterium]MCW5969399.1 transposase [Blastocatellales bacterium]